MSKKRCDECGRFMKLTDYLPDDDAFDEALAIECGLTEDNKRAAMFDIDGEWSRFRYVQDVWECDTCQTYQWHTEGPKYYWNPDSENYDGPKPKTPRELAAEQRQRQIDAGQLSLFDEVQS